MDSSCVPHTFFAVERWERIALGLMSDWTLIPNPRAPQRVYEPRHGSLKPGGVSLYWRHLSRCNSAGMTTASARMPMAIAVPAKITNHPKTIGTYTQPMMISITQWGMP